MTNIKKINSSDKKIWLKAIDAAVKGKLKQSITLYEQLLSKYSEDQNLNYELSLLYVKEEKYQSAYNCMEKIFEDFQDQGDHLDSRQPRRVPDEIHSVGDWQHQNLRRVRREWDLVLPRRPIRRNSQDGLAGQVGFYRI